MNPHRMNTGLVKHQAAIATLNTRVTAARKNLRNLRAVLIPLFCDENLINLLKVEGLSTVPSCINGECETNGANGRTRSIEEPTTGWNHASLSQWPRLDQESARLRKQLKKSMGANLQDVLMLTSLFCYLKSLLRNPSVCRYLNKHHPLTLHNLELHAKTTLHSTDESGVDMKNPTWTFAKAKADLDQVMKAAIKNGPQAISLKGKPSVLVVSVRTWKIMNRKSGSDDAPKAPIVRSTSKKNGRLREKPAGSTMDTLKV